MKIAGYYGRAARYIDEKEATRYIEGATPVVWAPEAPTPEAAVVTFDGRRGLFAFNNSGCPRHPQVRTHLKARLERLRRMGYRRIVLDELNYPTPHDGHLFFSCSCPHCTAEEPALARRPNPEEMAQARRRLIEKTLAEVAQEDMEAVLHPPTIAHYAGQDIATFLKYVDRVQVMLYHRCPGPGCLNRELAMLKRLTGIDPYGIDPDQVEKEGVPLHVLEEEARKVARYGDRVVPILWADEKLPEALEAVKNAGFDEVIIFAP